MLEKQVFAFGLLHQPAPQWEVNHWIDQEGRPAQFELSDFRGKVIYLLAFQSWCPGCYLMALPTLQRLHQAYTNQKDLQFVGIQTAFEELTVNSLKQLPVIQQKFNLSVPLGHQVPSEGERLPLFMNAYLTGGTPWVVIIDKQGHIAYNDFNIEESQARILLDQLLQP